jgi:2-polyprenyl-6-hydroxyphenyl methylase/3-demethylubiquinone-9 3-methyltransferase
MSDSAQIAALPDYGWTSAEAEDSHAYLEPALMKIIKRIDAKRADRSRPLRIFDAGCGNGALLKRLSACGYRVAGCDASASGAQQARTLCGPDIAIRQMSVYEDMLDAFGGNWDVVVSTEVIEHLYSPRDFLRRAEDMLAEQGTLVLSTPYHGYLKNLALAVTGALDAHFTALWDGGHIKFWSKRTLTELLREFGYVSVEFEGAGRLPWLWKSMVAIASKRL